MQPDHVLVEHGVAGGTELLDRGVDVDGVPQDDVVEHQAERARLVLQAGTGGPWTRMSVGSERTAVRWRASRCSGAGSWRSPREPTRNTSSVWGRTTRRWH